MRFRWPELFRSVWLEQNSLLVYRTRELGMLLVKVQMSEENAGISLKQNHCQCRFLLSGVQLLFNSFSTLFGAGLLEDTDRETIRGTMHVFP